jgi:glutamate--cysteine ligase
LSCLADTGAPLEERVEEYARLLLARLARHCGSPPRTYGFEYEWISRAPMDPRRLDAVVGRLTGGLGFTERGGQLERGGLRVVFEPGGQIEFLSPPLPPGAGEEVRDLLQQVRRILEDLRREVGVDYVARGFMPGRADAPLLLRDVRYTSMHDRFAASGRLGHHMMKGTAAVHLHAAVLAVEELPDLFSLLRDLAGGRLAMSDRRREIWASTDDCRCGMPPVPAAPEGPLDVLRPMVGQAMEAVELRTGRRFAELPCGGFEVFLAHFTTIFTDIRINLKGGTLELRTLDSLPPDAFLRAWSHFTSAVEEALPAD